MNAYLLCEVGLIYLLASFVMAVAPTHYWTVMVIVVAAYGLMRDQSAQALFAAREHGYVALVRDEATRSVTVIVARDCPWKWLVKRYLRELGGR